MYQNISYVVFQRHGKQLRLKTSTNNIPTGCCSRCLTFGSLHCHQVAQTAEITSRLNAALPAQVTEIPIKGYGFVTCMRELLRNTLHMDVVHPWCVCAYIYIYKYTVYIHIYIIGMNTATAGQPQTGPKKVVSSEHLI